MRTKQLLGHALIELIEENGFEGITVRDLTEKAGLNRGTFYLHYRDMDHLLEESKEEMMQGLLNLSAELSMEDSLLKDGEPHPVLIGVFEYLVQHRRFFSMLLGPKGDPAYLYKLKHYLQSTFYNKTSVQEQHPESPISRDYLIAYMFSANLGMIQHWFETGMTKTPHEMAKMITSLTSRLDEWMEA